MKGTSQRDKNYCENLTSNLTDDVNVNVFPLK